MIVKFLRDPPSAPSAVRFLSNIVLFRPGSDSGSHLADKYRDSIYIIDDFFFK